jgi:Family of unknown function (DUF6263)
MLRRLLLASLVLGIAILPTLGQDKDKDKKPDDKKPIETKPDDKKPDDKPTGDKVLLKLNLVKDKTFYQQLVTTTKQTMKVMQSDVVQEQKQTFYFSWTPIKQDGTTWTIKQKIEGVAMDIDIGNSKITYDSTTTKEAASNPLGDFFKALVGSEFTITVDLSKDVKVTKVEGRAEFLAKLVNANPNMKPLLEQILSEKALGEMAEPTFAAIPGTAESKGAKWKRESTLDMGPIGKYTNVYNYTFEGKEGKDLEKIKVETTLTYTQPPEGSGTGTGGLPFKIKKAELKSTNANGTILFDAKEGRIVESNMKLDLNGTLSIEIGGQTTEVTLSQTQSSTTKTGDKSFIPEKKQ